MQHSVPKAPPKDSQEFQKSCQIEWIPGLDCPLRLFAHKPIPDIHGKTVILFIHGYKGYAEWGCWRKMMEELAQAGTPAFRLDFSKNGTTQEVSTAIVDTESWSRNTYSREVLETISALRHLKNQGAHVVLMGHSRGGGIATCTTAATLNTGMAPKALVLLASVSDFRIRFPTGDALRAWKKSDCLPITNARTGETYCHKFIFYQDFITNDELLDIRRQAARIHLPVLAIHAKDDVAVGIEEFQELTTIFKRSADLKPLVYKEGGHTFGAREPWPENADLPNETAELVIELGRFVAQL